MFSNGFTLGISLYEDGGLRLDVVSSYFRGKIHRLCTDLFADVVVLGSDEYFIHVVQIIYWLLFYTRFDH